MNWDGMAARRDGKQASASSPLARRAPQPQPVTMRNNTLGPTMRYPSLQLSSQCSLEQPVSLLLDGGDGEWSSSSDHQGEEKLLERSAREEEQRGRGDLFQLTAGVLRPASSEGVGCIQDRGGGAARAWSPASTSGSADRGGEGTTPELGLINMIGGHGGKVCEDWRALPGGLRLRRSPLPRSRGITQHSDSFGTSGSLAAVAWRPVAGEVVVVGADQASRPWVTDVAESAARAATRRHQVTRARLLIQTHAQASAARRIQKVRPRSSNRSGGSDRDGAAAAEAEMQALWQMVGR